MKAFLLFFIYSFLGCVLENIYYFILHGKYISKRTLLALPLCPVYGIAALVLSFVNAAGAGMLLQFLTGVFCVSAVELMFYLISHRLFGIKWWDYSAMKFNLMGGVCLIYSAMWGILNIFFARFIQPFFLSWINTLPHSLIWVMGAFSFVYFSSELSHTVGELKKYKNGEDNCICKTFLYLK